MRYTFAPRAVVARARALALTGAAMSIAPPCLVLVLVVRLGLASRAMIEGVVAAIVALGAVRAVVVYQRAKRRFAALAIELDDADGGTALVRTARGETRIARASITRVVEIEGPLGGLRVVVTGADALSSFEVPRGGDGFAELRARLTTWAPIDRSRKRTLAARIALGVGVVLALFFVPFVVADARGSRIAVAVVLLVAWGAMRAATWRR